jgi:hypothetical protein
MVANLLLQFGNIKKLYLNLNKGREMSKKNKFENALEEMTVVDATPLEDVPEVPQITEEQQREVQDYIGRNPVVRAHLKTIEDYCVAMKPGKAMDPKNGAAWTQRLYAAFMAIISMENIGDMVDGLDAILDEFLEHRNGSLNMEYTQRFVDIWVAEESRRDLFTNLCYVFYTYCDTDKNNKVVKAMTLDGDQGMLKNMLPSQRERLINYLKRRIS